MSVERASNSLVPVVLPHQPRASVARREYRTSTVVSTTTPLSQWGFSTGANGLGRASWEADDAVRLAYYQNVYVWACARAIAEDIAALNFRAGKDPDDPDDWVPDAPLAKLLGPPTSKAPGGPCAKVSSKTFWEWLIVQLLVTGRFSAEFVDPGPNASLWPIPSQNIYPVPSDRPGEWFSGFRYGGWGSTKLLRPDQVFYHWRPSADDFRKPESTLQAARLDVSVAVMQDRYDFAFLKNDARPAAVVVHERFAEVGGAEKFQGKFLGDHQGPDNAGRPIFVETDPDGAPVKDAISITPLGLSQRDAEFIARHDRKIRGIIIAFGVPMSRLGDSSERTFSNAGQEYFNYYRKLKTICRELQDVTNTDIAPKIGKEYGWFDTTPLDEAIEDAKIQAAGLTDLVKTRIIQINESRAQLGLPAVPDGDRFLTDEELGLFQGAAAQILVQSVSPPAEQSAPASPSAEAPSGSPQENEADDSPTRSFAPVETRESEDARSERRTAAYNRRDRRVRAHEKAMQNAMQDILDRQAVSTVSRLTGKRGRQAMRDSEDRAAAAVDETFDSAFWVDETVKKMKPIYEAIFSDAAATILEELNSTDLFDVQDPTAYQFIERRVNKLAGNVTETTYEGIKRALAEGASEGESIPKLADRIRGLFEQTYRHRAETVARTEVIGAYNGSAYATGQSLPTDVVAGFEWLSTPGSRTRPAHAAADGQVVPTGMRFAVGGTEMSYPGDPSAPAGLIVNCRCTLLTLTPGEYQERTANPSVGLIVQRGRRSFMAWDAAFDAILSRAIEHPASEDGYEPGNGSRLPFHHTSHKREGSGHPFHGNQHTGGAGGAGWKPTMTAAEADEYVKGTAFPQPVYHGTGSGADSIMKNGFDMDKIGGATGNYGMIGKGVYVTSEKSYADVYAGSGKTLETRVLVKNPMPQDEFKAMVAEHNLTFTKEGSEQTTALAKERGYDGIRLVPNEKFPNFDEIVVFSPKQIVVVEG